MVISRLSFIRTQEFISYVRRQASFYNTNNIMLTMGMDFNYQAAHAWFMNLDKLISYVPQADNSINIFYSTPACYLNALHNEGISWPTKQDDFFPYASDPHAYWSGYFSSRPTSKFMIRQTEKTFKTLSQMMVLADLDYEGRVGHVIFRPERFEIRKVDQFEDLAIIVVNPFFMS